MNWISNVVPPKIRSFLRRDTPEKLWVKCPDSGQLVHQDVYKRQRPHGGTAKVRIPARAVHLFDATSGKRV